MNLSRLLIFADWYLPAHKAGGPIKSIHNLSLLLKESFYIKIFTSNKDFEEDSYLLNIEQDKWTGHEIGEVLYSSKSIRIFFQLIKEVNKFKPTAIYINSVFSFKFGILPLILYRFGFLKTNKVILAPRGMLHDGALKLKSQKKYFVLTLLKILGVYKKIYFHATDNTEKDDIVFRLGVKPQFIHEISNVPSNFKHGVNCFKRENELRLVFLARVCRKKNIGLVLYCLNLVPQKYTITFDVYGPEEDGYWNKMNHHISLLPKNVTVNYKGSLRFDQVESVLANYHAYILPSKGENFGHSIYEAMAMGLPVIISDQTPWKNLEIRKVGFDINLAQPEKYVQAICFFASQREDEWKQWSENANDFALMFYRSQNFKSDYTNMFKYF